MKKIIPYSLAAAFAFSAFSAYSGNMYFKNQGRFSQDSSWALDESKTQNGTVPTYEDTAVFYNVGGVSWITNIDTYVGNLILTKGANLSFGNQVLNQSVPANFTVNGAIKAQITDQRGDMVFGESFGDYEGTAAVEINAGSLEVGCEVYDNRTFSSYVPASLAFKFQSEQVTNATLNVSGDVKVGGVNVDGINAAATISLGLDNVNVAGVMHMASNGSGYTYVSFDKECVLEVGGLSSLVDNKDVTIANGAGKAYNSSIVFKNAAGTDCQYIGVIADDGNNRNLEDVRGVVNITMDGDGTQRLYSSLKDNMEIKGSQLGTYTVKRGRLFMDNSRIASTHRLAALVMEGGEFGAAHYNSTSIGTAYFKSGEIRGGGFAFENFESHNALELLMTDKIVFSETLAKSADSGKIGINFTSKDGAALDLANYDYVIAEDAESIENWIEIITAGDLSGFDLESKLGENVYDANGDFYAIGVENGVAIFRWVESLDNGYSLQVGFAQVPEPAAVAALFGMLALGFAALRRRRR